jgi:hypothetical protein
LILTELNSGADTITATACDDVVIDEDPYDKMMDEEDKMMKSPQSAGRRSPTSCP